MAFKLDENPKQDIHKLNPNLIMALGKEDAVLNDESEEEPSPELNAWDAYGGFPESVEEVIRTKITWSYTLQNKLKNTLGQAGIKYVLRKDPEKNSWKLVLIITKKVERLLIQSGSETGKETETFDYSEPPNATEVQKVRKKAEQLLASAGI